jgi:hypothetical protein
MTRMRKAALGALTAILATAAISVPAANADLVIPFNNYKVGGSLTVKKLAQAVSLPDGSTFNGTANLTTHVLEGHVFVPQFTSTINVAGIPTEVTTKLKEVKPVLGTIGVTSTAATIHATTSAILRIRKMKLGLLSVPTTCRTERPILLTMDFTGPLIYPIAFDGTTTIPKLTNCGLLGPTLTALMSGPDNPYHITLAPPTP